MKCKRKLFLKQNIIILNKTHVAGTYLLIDGFKNKLKRKNLLRVTQKILQCKNLVIFTF